MNYLLITVLSGIFSLMGIVFLRQGTLMPAQEQMDSSINKQKEFILNEKCYKWKPYYIAAMVLCMALIGYSQVWRYPEISMLHNAKVLACFGILWSCAWIDAFELRIPNKIIIYGFLVRCILLLSELTLGVGGLGIIVIRELIIAGIMLFCTVICCLIVPKSIGAGDIKLLVLMSLFLGTGGIWDAVFCAMIILFCVSLAMLLFRKANRNDALPFAPFIMIGTICAAFIAGI